MKRAFLAATALATVALSMPAYAITVTLETGGQVEAIVGDPANRNPNYDDTINQFANVTTPAAIINPNATPVGTFQVQADAGDPPFQNIEAATVTGIAVTTNDGTAVGTVSGVATTTDGETVLLVDVTADLGVSTLGIRVSSVIQTQAGFVIQTDAADLAASVTAAKNGEPMPAPPAAAPAPAGG